MDEFDYDRVCRIIRYVLRQPHLTPEDKDEIRQEAAIAAVRYGFEPSTRIYYTALDAARRIRQLRLWNPIEHDVRDQQDIERMVEFERLLSTLSVKERFAIEGTLRGYKQSELGEMINRDETQICRYRRLGFEKLRKQIK